ncbi:hypothetical protein DFS33DRAFT_1272081 [Desarmillaria ectypa]|nr:hypothetical protein DFS33DRAFT_1272081 [Desarmillaria ectypa]
MIISAIQGAVHPASAQLKASGCAMDCIRPPFPKTDGMETKSPSQKKLHFCRPGFFFGVLTEVSSLCGLEFDVGGMFASGDPNTVSTAWTANETVHCLSAASVGGDEKCQVLWSIHILLRIILLAFLCHSPRGNIDPKDGMIVSVGDVSYFVERPEARRNHTNCVETRYMGSQMSEEDYQTVHWIQSDYEILCLEEGFQWLPYLAILSFLWFKKRAILTSLSAMYNVSDLELGIRMASVGWMKRLWTLQEAALSIESKSSLGKMYFQMRDGPIRWKELLHTFQHMPSKPRSKPLLRPQGLLFGLWMEESITSRLPFVSDLQPSGWDTQFQRLARAVQNRTTSKSEDEAICLASLAGLDISNILSVQIAEERMQHFYPLLRDIPATIIFAQLPIFATPNHIPAPNMKNVGHLGHSFSTSQKS